MVLPVSVFPLRLRSAPVLIHHIWASWPFSFPSNMSRLLWLRALSLLFFLPGVLFLQIITRLTPVFLHPGLSSNVTYTKELIQSPQLKQQPALLHSSSLFCLLHEMYYISINCIGCSQACCAVCLLQQNRSFLRAGTSSCWPLNL